MHVETGSVAVVVKKRDDFLVFALGEELSVVLEAEDCVRGQAQLEIGLPAA